MRLPIILAASALLFLIPLASQDSFAQVNSGGFQAGGVNIDGSWYVGEGLKSVTITVTICVMLII